MGGSVDATFTTTTRANSCRARKSVMSSASRRAASAWLPVNPAGS
jgi:hypothetical protein